MYKKTPVISVLLLLCTQDAMAVEWTSIIKDKDQEVFVDIDSYNVEDGYPYISAKTIFNKNQTHVLNKNSINYAYSIKKMQFNCKKPFYKIKTMTFYDQQQSLIGSHQAATDFQSIHPNTNEFSIGQLTCQVHRMLGGQ